MRKVKKQINQKNHGITLIALVITIIVLLILAGVTIATLTGSNGILTRANEASRESEIASVKEQAQLDITNWIAEELKNGRDGTIDEWTDIKTILDTANPDEGNRYYVEVTEDGVKTPNGYIIPIEALYTNPPSEEDGPVFDENTLTIGDAINSDKYGWKVTNYTVQTPEMSTNVWRLFYQDSNYTYLIVDESIGSYIPSRYYSSYENASSVSTIGQRLNPMLLEKGTFFVESNVENNLRATAWLTDTTKWTAYVNEDAIFAIASPTLELYSKSFNATASANETKEIRLTVSGKGYYETSHSTLETSYNFGIYNKDTASSWWIASPSFLNGNNAFTVEKVNKYFGSNTVISNSYAIRPVVCLATSVFNNKYSSSLVNE